MERGEMKADKRTRRTIQTQLDIERNEELAIKQYHDALKDTESEYHGNWKAELVKAILLHIDLTYEDGKYRLAKYFPELAKAKRLYEGIKKGDFGVFQELFPERYNVLCLTVESRVLERVNHESHQEVLKQLDAIRAKLDSLNTSPVQAPAALQQIAGVKPIAAPNFDEDEDEDLFSVKKDKNGGAIAANNFLASLKRLNA